MGIPKYIKDVSLAVKNDERISRKRTAYVNRFCGQLETRARALRLKDSDLRVIRTTYEYGIQLLEDRILMTCVRGQSEHLKPSKLEQNIRVSEFNFMSKFIEELETEESPDYEDTVFLSRHSATGPHPINPVLSLYNSELTQTLDTVGTTVIDVLAKHDVITESDEEVITSGHSRQDRNRHLLAVLSTSAPEKDMGCFVDFLQEYHEPLGARFAATVRQYASEPPDQICAACTVVTMVDPGRLAKVMFERRHIPGNFYTDLRSRHLSTEKKWKLIRQKGLEEEAILALRPKYDHFFHLFIGQRDLTCTCKDSDVVYPVHNINRTSSKNSGPSSFKRWSAKNSGNEDMDNVLAKLQQLSSSVDDLKQIVSDQFSVEAPSRPASMPDVVWPPHKRGSFTTLAAPVLYQDTDYASPYLYLQSDSEVDTRLKPKRKKSIFIKIKQKFTSKEKRS